MCVLTAGCGGDDPGVTVDAPRSDSSGSGTVDAAVDSPPASTFTLTSSAYTEGQPIPPVHSCDGANTSPPLAWTNPPSGAMSFAIVFTDKTNGLIHSIIYDIPSTTTSLPAAVEKEYAPASVAGAHQTPAYNTTRGYMGPCPSPADPAHTYELAIYAINATTLPGSMMSTTRAQANTAIQANNLGVAKLTGTFDH